MTRDVPSHFFMSTVHIRFFTVLKSLRPNNQLSAIYSSRNNPHSSASFWCSSPFSFWLTDLMATLYQSNEINKQ